MISVVKDSIEIDKNKLRMIHLEVKILRQKRPRSFFFLFLSFVFVLFYRTALETLQYVFINEKKYLSACEKL